MVDPHCPGCGAPYGFGTKTCPRCGADVADRPPGVDALLAGLEDLQSEADGALVDELDALTRAAAVRADAAATSGGLRAADLTTFVHKVETRMDRPPGTTPWTIVSPPRANRMAAPTLGASALLYAAGVFLLPLSALSSVLTLMAAVGLTVAGLGLRYARPGQ